MRITHKLDDRDISGETNEEAGFLITNKAGGFFSSGISSRYGGLFFKSGESVIKILDNISIKGETKEIINNFWHTIRNTGDNSESFFMPFGTNSLVYELGKQDEIELFLDVKKPYDNRVWGRRYAIYQEKDKLIIEFNKVTDNKEDQSQGDTEYTIYIAVDITGGSFEKSEEWVNKTYSFDRARGSHPWERYVYKPMKIKTNKLIIAVSEDKNDAIDICNRVATHLAKYRSLQKKYSQVSIKEAKNNKINFALKCATESLDNLLVGGDNIDIYAGLPWFFQYWSRDTLISLKALMYDKEYDTVKKILMKYLHYIQEDGLLMNRMPAAGMKSIDSIGWYFKRWGEFIDILSEEKQMKNYFRKSEILFIVKKLEESMNRVFRNYTLDSMAINQNQETWMDTLYEGDGRKGTRIEIQALRAAMYDLLFKLTNNRIYKDMLHKIIMKVREHFWNGSYLKDGLGDDTIRPNVFIAAYIYPDLLSKDQWTTCFLNVLPRLWLDWGGLATIDKTDRRFQPYHTGENDASYHRGDSWYWVNNLAAIVLNRVDKYQFKDYIDKIVEASANDILFMGYIGAHSEISSASKQIAQGCLSQAWSNALFVELVEELYSD